MFDNLRKMDRIGCVILIAEKRSFLNMYRMSYNKITVKRLRGTTERMKDEP